MDRKIQTILYAENVNSQSVPIFVRVTNYQNGQEKLQLLVTVLRYINAKNVTKFARRAFSGARKLVFTLNTAADVGTQYKPGASFISSDDGHFIELCADSTREILGVGKKTKTFSLWVK